MTIVKAIRQYRHNNSNGFVIGYDVDAVNEYVAEIKKEKAALESEVAELKSKLKG